MPRFSAQIFSQDGDVIASNVDMLINFSRQGVLQNWDGNFDLSPTPQFNPNSVNRTATYKVVE
jgi:hypothetical protein